MPGRVEFGASLPLRRPALWFNELRMPLANKIHQVRAEIDDAAAKLRSADELMKFVVERMHDRMLKYNWVGFYLIERDRDTGQDLLVLGHFVGAMTPHTKIKLNQGICGAAASSGKTVVVDDVQADPRYLACSVETRSEIVVPVFVRGRVVGELDIDSHFPAAFAAEDREFVEYCAALVGKRLEKTAR
jgi:L-methionine (R)-S-oxide reductase